MAAYTETVYMTKHLQANLVSLKNEVKTGLDEVGAVELLDNAVQYAHERAVLEGAPLRDNFTQSTFADDDALCTWTGFNRADFALIYRNMLNIWPVMEWMEMARQEQVAKDRKGVPGPKPKWLRKNNRNNHMPLIHEEPVRSSDPDNRCKLEPIHILLLTMMRKYIDLKQKPLARIFEVDQRAISDYLEFGNRMLAAVLPTPERFMALLKDIDDVEEFQKIFPDGVVLIMDGTHVRFCRPGDNGTRKDMYSGKKKTFTGNTILFVTPTGLIIAMSDTYEGHTADITTTRQFLPQLGEFAKKILQDSRAGKEFRLDGDLGFLRLDKNVPGAEVRTPKKRPRDTKKKKGKLTPEQKAYNKEFSRKRVIVENAIGEAKHFRRASNVYDGTLEEFNREFNVMCGLANFRRMRRDGTYGYWMRILEEQAPLPPE